MNNIFTFLRDHKFTSMIIIVLFGLFLWANISGFKLFKSEYGADYKSQGHNGSIHHK